MKYCDKCHLNVNTNGKICPLCGEILKSEDNVLVEATYPDYNVMPKKSNITLKIIKFILIVGSIASLVINHYTFKTQESYWSLYVVSSAIYGWILLRHTILSKSNMAVKMVIQTLCLSAYIIAINIILTIPNIMLTWSVVYIVPFITIASTLTILFIVAIKKIKYKDYLMHLFISLLLGIIPYILNLIKVIKTDVKWPALASAGLSIIVIIGIIIFADKQTKKEIRKRFHI